MLDSISIKNIKAKLFSNQSGQRGDTLVETLVALMIAALSLTLLAMAISTTSSLAQDSKDALEDLYAVENALADEQPSEDCQGEMTITLSNGDELMLSENGNGEFSYRIQKSNSKFLVAYEWEDGEDA